MIERIKQLITDKKLTLSSFATETKINPATINHIINGREVEGKGKVNQTPSTDVITKILSTFPDINVEWLLMGTGPMYKGQRTFVQPDLFLEKAIKLPTPPTIPENRMEIEDKTEENDIKVAVKQPIMQELSLSENIDKIVIFFKNKTYVTLKPEE
ncbi:MAG: helix-turn-helix domain-containing protein [Dysgonamonadaceae bacterium]|jgi:transcriptional regulator with XRE-family HTH domain|nr:helix-turn-helix domain-containing protein [Dysgonamonadaceae bacterium]